MEKTITPGAAIEPAEFNPNEVIHVLTEEYNPEEIVACLDEALLKYVWYLCNAEISPDERNMKVYDALNRLRGAILFGINKEYMFIKSNI